MILRRAAKLALRPSGPIRGAHSASPNPSAYCRDLVRKHDYDSLLCSYFYPRSTLDAYFAVKAFNIELASVQDTVSNQTIGKMRMQFWRDAVKSIQKDSPPPQPIALALHQAYKQFKIPTYHLTRMVDARDADLFAPTHSTADSFGTYAESTSSTQLYILLHILGLSSSSTLAHAASHLGIASSITTQLRSIAYHASLRRMVIPAEISSKHGVREEEVFRRGGEAQGIQDAVFEWASVANDHVHAARELFEHAHDEGWEGKVPREAVPVFLSAVPVAHYLEALENVNFDAFDASVQRRDHLKLPWRIWKANSSRTF